MTAANFAYRLAATGVEAVQKAFSDTEKTALRAFNDSGRAAKGFNRDLEDLTDHLRKVSSAADGFKNLRNNLLALAGAGGMGLLIRNSLNAAANIGDMAAQAGQGVEQFQELEFALRRFNVRQEQAVKGMQELNVRAVEFARDNAGGAKNAFERLGFTREAVAEGLQNADRFFEQVLERVGVLESEAEKVEVLKRIFGQSAGPALINAVNAGVAAIRAGRIEAQELNYVIRQELVDAAERANNQLQKMGDVLSRQLVIAIVENADELENLLDLAIKGIPPVIGFFSDLATKISEVATALKTTSERLAELGRNASIRGLIPSIAESTSMWQAQLEIQRMMQTDLQRGAFWQGGGAAGRLNETVSGAMARGKRGYQEDFYSIMGINGKSPQLPGGNGLIDSTKELTDANKRLIESLQFEIEMLRLTDREQAVARAERNLSAEATAAQRAQVRELAGALYDEQQALRKSIELEEQAKKKKEALRKEVRDLASEMAGGFEKALAEGKKLNDVLDEMYQYITRMAIRKSLTEPLTDFALSLFDGIDFGSMFGGAPGRAAGGPVYAGELYRVNERQNVVEGFRPSTGGQIIPLGAGGGANVSVIINNNSNAVVQQPEVTRGGDGMTEIKMQLDQEVSSLMKSPFSKTGQALREAGSTPSMRR